MKKETGFAIFLGIAFGIVVSLVMILKTKDTQLGKSKPLTSEKKAAPVALEVENQPNIAFKITEPSDKAIVSGKTVVFKGEAQKDALLVVQSPIKDIAMKLDKDTFSFTMPLAMGENVISLTIYPNGQQGRGQQKELRVYSLDEQ